MSFPTRFNPYFKFRETLKHEDHIHNQIESCRTAFNRGETTEIMYATETLLRLITPAMIDEDYLADMQQLDDEWQEKRAEMEAEYTERLKQAVCPDVVPKPTFKPDKTYFSKAFMIACALFERKNLMLKQEKEDNI